MVLCYSGEEFLGCFFVTCGSSGDVSQPGFVKWSILVVVVEMVTRKMLAQLYSFLGQHFSHSFFDKRGCF